MPATATIDETATKATTEAKVAAKLAEWGITYSAEFVPLSMSRNADKGEPSLNWKVTNGNFTTDYMQGIGHMPGYEARNTLEQVESRKRAAEDGRWAKRYSDFGFGRIAIPSPSAADVLYCLLTDADVIDYASFEDWASEFGYDTDSRKAEQNYRACMDTALRMRQVLGDARMAELRELLADY